MLSQMNQALPPTPGSQESHTVETLPLASAPTPSQIQKQFELAAHPAVKIYVRHEGWYRVTQPDLVKAGLDPNVDPALLHLYAEATEQPIADHGRDRRSWRLRAASRHQFLRHRNRHRLLGHASLLARRRENARCPDPAASSSPPARTSLRRAIPQPWNCSSTRTLLCGAADAERGKLLWRPCLAHSGGAGASNASPQYHFHSGGAS